MKYFKKPAIGRKYLKVAIIGEEGTGKTRTTLQFPGLAIIDTERGTEHYAEYADFDVMQSSDPKEIMLAIDSVLQEDAVETIAVDSWTIFCKRIFDMFVDTFESAEKKKGKAPYRLSPADYAPINRRMDKVISKLISADKNVIVTMQMKNKWDGLNVVGKESDGYKRTEHYMDTVIHLRKRRSAKTGEMSVVADIEKDRTGCLPARIIDFSYDSLKEYWGDFLGESKPKKSASKAKKEEESATEEKKTFEEIKNEVLDEATPPDEPHDDTVMSHEENLESLHGCLEDIFDILEVPDKQQKGILKKRKAKKIPDLNEKEAKEILLKLEKMLEEKDEDAFAGYLDRWTFRTTAL